jgi:hypothetical protein
MISGQNHDEDEICTLLGYYKAQSDNSIPKFLLELPDP